MLNNRLGKEQDSKKKLNYFYLFVDLMLQLSHLGKKNSQFFYNQLSIKRIATVRSIKITATVIHHSSCAGIQYIKNFFY